MHTLFHSHGAYFIFTLFTPDPDEVEASIHLQVLFSSFSFSFSKLNHIHHKIHFLVYETGTR